jgi:hypothetical protein
VQQSPHALQQSSHSLLQHSQARPRHFHAYLCAAPAQRTGHPSATRSTSCVAGMLKRACQKARNARATRHDGTAVWCQCRPGAPAGITGWCQHRRQADSPQWQGVARQAQDSPQPDPGTLGGRAQAVAGHRQASPGLAKAGHSRSSGTSQAVDLPRPENPARRQCPDTAQRSPRGATGFRAHVPPSPGGDPPRAARAPPRTAQVPHSTSEGRSISQTYSVGRPKR